MADTEYEQKQQVLFMQLVLTFSNAAWQQMGKIKNPVTDRVERDLNQARFSIDILDMIRHKMQGNLSEAEQMFIDKSVSELQLNFVAEYEKEKGEGKPEGVETPSSSETGEAGSAPKGEPAQKEKSAQKEKPTQKEKSAQKEKPTQKEKPAQKEKPTQKEKQDGKSSLKKTTKGSSKASTGSKTKAGKTSSKKSSRSDSKKSG